MPAPAQPTGFHGPFPQMQMEYGQSTDPIGSKEWAPKAAIFTSDGLLSPEHIRWICNAICMTDAVESYRLVALEDIIGAIVRVPVPPIAENAAACRKLLFVTFFEEAQLKQVLSFVPKARAGSMTPSLDTIKIYSLIYPSDPQLRKDYLFFFRKVNISVYPAIPFRGVEADALPTALLMRCCPSLFEGVNAERFSAAPGAEDQHAAEPTSTRDKWTSRLVQQRNDLLLRHKQFGVLEAALSKALASEAADQIETRELESLLRYRTDELRAAQAEVNRAYQSLKLKDHLDLGKGKTALQSLSMLRGAGRRPLSSIVKDMSYVRDMTGLLCFVVEDILQHEKARSRKRARPPTGPGVNSDTEQDRAGDTATKRGRSALTQEYGASPSTDASSTSNKGASSAAGAFPTQSYDTHRQSLGSRIEQPASHPTLEQAIAAANSSFGQDVVVSKYNGPSPPAQTPEIVWAGSQPVETSRTVSVALESPAPMPATASSKSGLSRDIGSAVNVQSKAGPDVSNLTAEKAEKPHVDKIDASERLPLVPPPRLNDLPIHMTNANITDLTTFNSSNENPVDPTLATAIPCAIDGAIQSSTNSIAPAGAPRTTDLVARGPGDFSPPTESASARQADTTDDVAEGNEEEELDDGTSRCFYPTEEVLRSPPPWFLPHMGDAARNLAFSACNMTDNPFAAIMGPTDGSNIADPRGSQQPESPLFDNAASGHGSASATEVEGGNRSRLPGTRVNPYMQRSTDYQGY